MAHQFLSLTTVPKRQATEGMIEFTFLSSFDLQTAVHKLMLSSNLLTPGSPSSLSSKTDMGARKIIALTSMKYGCHTPRFRRLIRRKVQNAYICGCAHERSCPSNVVKNPFAAYISTFSKSVATANYTPISLERIKGNTHLWRCCPTRSDIPVHLSSVTAHERRPHLSAHNLDLRCDRGHPRSYVKRRWGKLKKRNQERKQASTHNPD